MAVISVRCMVRKLRNKAILQKERIILLHTALFSLYFIVYAIDLIAENVMGASPEDSSRYCKALIVEIASLMSLSILNMSIYVLITYMSVQFCKPLNGQWQKFLLGYLEKSLNTYLREQCTNSTDQERAKRFHDVAV